MARVLVTPHLLQRRPGPYRDLLEQAGHEVVFPPIGVDTLQREVIRRLLIEEQVEGMLASTEPLDREILGASRLKIVARQGVGYDSVDIAAASELGIAVTITPGTLEASVAEQTLALLLGISRAVIDRDRQVRAGDWSRVALPRMAGKIFGIIGVGRIGRAVIRRMQGLEMSVLGFDPLLTDADAAAIGIERVATVNELLDRADIVSLHCPCTPSTRNLIDSAALARMKPRAILLNMGRGGLVDEDALVASLVSGHLLGAGLDVFAREPLPLDSPLLGAPRLILSTHMGGLDDEGQIAASSLAARCIVDVLAGRLPTDCLVDRSLRRESLRG
ncbi:MAG TPA: hypothetical protein DCQ98_02420 [Planctomycetaceae bacterium]|nr:hypothetical protein [Planctomycetaceae bacterium]HRE99063.1 phosphoglycerate dehydrogenase [Pirellulaceae bacterium]